MAQLGNLHDERIAAGADGRRLVMLSSIVSGGGCPTDEDQNRGKHG
jgi:hypothetical protein